MSEVLIVWVYPVKCDVTDTADVGVRGHIGHCLPDKVLHLFQPALVLWVDLVGFLDCFERVDLQRIFLRYVSVGLVVGLFRLD